MLFPDFSMIIIVNSDVLRVHMHRMLVHHQEELCGSWLTERILRAAGETILRFFIETK